jgi:hypothetical protein
MAAAITGSAARSGQNSSAASASRAATEVDDDAFNDASDPGHSGDEGGENSFRGTSAAASNASAAVAAPTPPLMPQAAARVAGVSAAASATTAGRGGIARGGLQRLGSDFPGGDDEEDGDDGGLAGRGLSMTASFHGLPAAETTESGAPPTYDALAAAAAFDYPALGVPCDNVVEVTTPICLLGAPGCGKTSLVQLLTSAQAFHAATGGSSKATAAARRTINAVPSDRLSLRDAEVMYDCPTMLIGSSGGSSSADVPTWCTPAPEAEANDADAAAAQAVFVRATAAHARAKARADAAAAGEEDDGDEDADADDSPVARHAAAAFAASFCATPSIDFGRLAVEHPVAPVVVPLQQPTKQSTSTTKKQKIVVPPLRLVQRLQFWDCSCGLVNTAEDAAQSVEQLKSDLLDTVARTGTAFPLFVIVYDVCDAKSLADAHRVWAPLARAVAEAQEEAVAAAAKKANATSHDPEALLLRAGGESAGGEPSSSDGEGAPARGGARLATVDGALRAAMEHVEDVAGAPFTSTTGAGARILVVGTKTDKRKTIMGATAKAKMVTAQQQREATAALTSFGGRLLDSVAAGTGAGARRLLRELCALSLLAGATKTSPPKAKAPAAGRLSAAAATGGLNEVSTIRAVACNLLEEACLLESGAAGATHGRAWSRKNLLAPPNLDLGTTTVLDRDLATCVVIARALPRWLLQLAAPGWVSAAEKLDAILRKTGIASTTAGGPTKMQTAATKPAAATPAPAESSSKQRPALDAIADATVVRLPPGAPLPLLGPDPAITPVRPNKGVLSGSTAGNLDATTGSNFNITTGGANFTLGGPLAHHSGANAGSAALARSGDDAASTASTSGGGGARSAAIRPVKNGSSAKNPAGAAAVGSEGQQCCNQQCRTG